MLALVLPLVVVLFGGVPVLLLNRPAARERARSAAPRALAAWWLLAALPWIAVWTWIARDGRFTIAVDDGTAAARAIVAALLALVVLVSLPSAVVTATYLRLRAAVD